MPDTHPFRSGCPISTTLDILGDRWSMLILRDMAFEGATSFSAFAAAEEKIATNILSDRLARLAAHGLIAAEKDPVDGRRTRYRLTEKGWDYVPVLLEIILWAAKHEDTLSPPPVVAAIRADRAGFLARLRDARAAGAPGLRG